MLLDGVLRIPLIEKSEPEASDGRQYWRPWALRKSALISFVGLCVGLLIANELAGFGCRRNGSCYVFGDSVSRDGEMPTPSIFVYRTVPTVLGIALGLRWYVTHYDITRLEAYAQLSSEHGAKASNSLFLQYPYEFVLVLPFKALLKQHHVVALSSSILFTVSYALVPLLSNMFDTNIGKTSRFINASRVEFNTTARQVNANFTFSAYDVQWRGRSELPPFTTTDFSLLPVTSLEESPVFHMGENWTFVTTQYEADLECAEADHINYNYSIYPDNNHLVIDIFQDQSSNSFVRVCDALGQERADESTINNKNKCQDLVSFLSPWTASYARLMSPVEPDEYIEPAMFMFSWASGSPSGYPKVNASIISPRPLSLTAIFCTPKYYAQTVNATVSMPSGIVHPHAVHPIGKRVEIDSLEGFADLIEGAPLTKPELWLESVFVPQKDRVVVGVTPLRFGYPVDRIVNLKDDLEERFGNATRPVKPQLVTSTSESNIFMSATNTLMAFTLGGIQNNRAELEKLLNPEELEGSLRKALKLWFAFAVAMETARSDERTTIMVEQNLQEAKITVNQYWSLAARIGLPLVVALGALLTYLLEGRPYRIDGEPTTIAAALKLLSASPALCAVMRHSEYHPMKTLMEELDRRGFFFKLGPGTEGTLRIGVFRGEGDGAEEVLEGSGDLNVLEAPAPGSQVQKDVEYVSPDLIAKANIVLFPIFILALIVAIAWSKARNGFPMPDHPTMFWSKTCFGAIPVAFGMMAEALLVLLGATQCMMVPYQALVMKKAKYIDTLNFQYKRNPPHLQLFKSFNRGQYTLFILSLTILISNALPVAISSIFINIPDLPRDAKLHKPLEDIPRARQEMFFQLNREIDTPTYAPSWTTPEYYIDSPFTIAPIGDSRTYATYAFGIDVDCTLVPENKVTVVPASNVTLLCSTIERAKNDSIPPVCVDGWNNTDNIMLLHSPCGGDEPSISITWRGSSLDHVKTDVRCPDFIFPLWAQNHKWTVDKPDRIAQEPGYNDTVFDFPGENQYDFVVLNCSIADRIAKVDATVDRGHVTNVKNEVFESSEVTKTKSLARQFIKATEKLARDYKVYGNFPIQDINFLVAQLDQTVARNETHVPSSGMVAKPFADVLKRLFPLLLRLYAEQMFGVKYVTEYMEYRAHIENISFSVAMGVLVLCLCVVVNVYTKHRGKVLGHLPWSLAGLYSQLYASNARSLTNRAAKGHEIVEVDLSAEYAYGDYPKDLGKHYGVYRVGGEDPYPPMENLLI